MAAASLGDAELDGAGLAVAGVDEATLGSGRVALATP
jgi:hypothetical protein